VSTASLATMGSASLSLTGSDAAYSGPTEWAKRFLEVGGPAADHGD
jgi:hypothetical protein